MGSRSKIVRATVRVSRTTQEKLDRIRRRLEAELRTVDGQVPSFYRLSYDDVVEYLADETGSDLLETEIGNAPSIGVFRMKKNGGGFEAGGGGAGGVLPFVRQESVEGEGR